ncbi:TetR/AcrR family transcriptional regulator [Streptomyces rectiverticillatus]|uniref:TetR/AcrR family transcriptional regulator n=1 Tax=Streptomyces rectiverticillatus TaxID=173860 RepID=UPI0015C3273C|nr:TetR/AcrR family transcriptional regulator [Streptomyces rectiverticillatus]QLE70932.1 TetR/AcrR family transcriptional regulator [Streptomyces rectiverticillatus]
MARKPTPDARDRILDAAADLFDRFGVHAVGMQQIIEELGCGKQLLYREFASKDKLVVAYLQRCTRDWDVTLASAAAAASTPEEQLVEVVRAVQRMAPGTRGCSLRNTHAEFPDPDHPAHRVSLEHFKEVREQLRELARRTSAANPERLGDRIMLIIDGLYVSGSVLGPSSAAAEAVEFARDVIRAETSVAVR